MTFTGRELNKYDFLQTIHTLFSTVFKGLAGLPLAPCSLGSIQNVVNEGTGFDERGEDVFDHLER